MCFGFHLFNCLLSPREISRREIKLSLGHDTFVALLVMLMGMLHCLRVRPVWCDSVEVTHQGWRWLYCEKSEVTPLFPVSLNYSTTVWKWQIYHCWILTRWERILYLILENVIFGDSLEGRLDFYSVLFVNISNWGLC